MGGEGTLFQLTIEGRAVSNGMAIHEQMFFADISWISWYPQEEETFTEAGVRIDIEQVLTISEAPRIEHVIGRLSSGFDFGRLEEILRQASQFDRFFFPIAPRHRYKRFSAHPDVLLP